MKGIWIDQKFRDSVQRLRDAAGRVALFLLRTDPEEEDSRVRSALHQLRSTSPRLFQDSRNILREIDVLDGEVTNVVTGAEGAV